MVNYFRGFLAALTAGAAGSRHRNQTSRRRLWQSEPLESRLLLSAETSLLSPACNDLHCETQSSDDHPAAPLAESAAAQPSAAAAVTTSAFGEPDFIPPPL